MTIQLRRRPAWQASSGALVAAALAWASASSAAPVETSPAPTPPVATPRNETPRDATSRDTTPPDTTPRDKIPRDGTPPGVAPPATAPPVAPREPSDLSSLLEPICAQHKVPGMAIAVVTANGVEALGFAGVRVAGADAKIERGDAFHIGSCTKAMTSTLAALLVREGAISWDARVGDVLGKSIATIDPSWNRVTLEELCGHVGGAPASPSPAAWKAAWECRESPQECRHAFVEALLAVPIAQPRGTFTYSNQGYAIAGAMLEEASGRDYETLITEKLFAPLGMTSAGFGPPSAAHGHGTDGTENNGDNPNAISPAGRAHMSIEDWAKFVSLHLRRDGGSALPLTRGDFDHLQSVPTPPADAAAVPATGAPSSAALGWMVTTRSWGGRVLTHGGSNTLWYCVAWLAPERGFAVIAMSNQGGPEATKACDEACAGAIAWRTAQSMRMKAKPGAAPPKAPATAP